MLSYPFYFISFCFSVFSVVFVAFIFICTLGIFHSSFLSFKRFIQPLSKKKLKCVFLKAAEPNVFLFFFLHNKNKFFSYVSVLWIGNIFPFLILIYFLFLPYFYILKLKIWGLGIFFWVWQCRNEPFPAHAAFKQIRYSWSVTPLFSCCSFFSLDLRLVRCVPHFLLSFRLQQNTFYLLLLHFYLTRSKYLLARTVC